MKKIWSLLLVLVLLLSACGGTDNAATDSGDTGNTDSGEVKKGGNVSIPIVGDPIFNPWHPNAYEIGRAHV